MKFNSIHLTNYRCHSDLQVEFKPGFNVIVGINGSGKTSLLAATFDAMAAYIIRMKLPVGLMPPMSDPGVVRIQAEVMHGRYRFEPQYPVRIQASVTNIDLSVSEWMVSLENGLDTLGVINPSSGLGVNNILLPILAFYRADRNWSGVETTEIQAATQRNTRADGYVGCWNASVEAAALQAWVISKCLERFQTSSETGTPFDDIDSDELALVNQALAVAVEGTKGLKYDLKQKSLLVEWTATEDATRQPTAFENLSDGQRSVIGLVADIARRMCILNPQLGQDVARKTPGVVLIDELDMHLHPRWQRILTGGLKRAFPAVQFIVASHSPQVLGELHPEEIILLRPNGTAHPQVSYGLTSSQVLEEIMGAEARTPEVQRMVTELFEDLARGELQAARELLVKLEDIASGIPELAGAKALLRRKELLGR